MGVVVPSASSEANRWDPRVFSAAFPCFPLQGAMGGTGGMPRVGVCGRFYGSRLFAWEAVVPVSRGFGCKPVDTSSPVRSWLGSHFLFTDAHQNRLLPSRDSLA